MKKSLISVLVVLLTAVFAMNAQAVRLPETYAEESEKASIKATAQVIQVKTLNSSKRYSRQKTIFSLIKNYFETTAPSQFSGISSAVLWPWQNPGEGGEVFIYPKVGDVVFVTVSKDGGRISSYTNLTDGLQKALEQTPERIRFGITHAYVGASPTGGEVSSAVRQSQQAWLYAKIRHGANYSYVASDQSWVGITFTTRIQVLDDQVTNRSYWESHGNAEAPHSQRSYEETSTTLGMHAYGAAPVTIDRLYEICTHQWLTQKEHGAEVLFQVGDDGLLRTCGYIRPGCADDCFIGVTIDRIEWIKKQGLQ